VDRDHRTIRAAAREPGTDVARCDVIRADPLKSPTAICRKSLQSLAQSERPAGLNAGIHARVENGIHGVPSSVAVIAPKAGVLQSKTNEATGAREWATLAS
jgi:hypothetical protein